LNQKFNSEPTNSCTEREATLPDIWDPATYRERAKAWRDKAASFPEKDPNRATCVEIAVGYEKLAALLEQRVRGPRYVRADRPPHGP
jgi:hypothetical protein